MSEDKDMGHNPEAGHLLSNLEVAARQVLGYHGMQEFLDGHEQPTSVWGVRKSDLLFLRGAVERNVHPAIWALARLDMLLRCYPCNDICSSQLIGGMKCDCWKYKVREALTAK